MKLKHSKGKRRRIFKSYKRPLSIEVENKWFTIKETRWINLEDSVGGGISNVYYAMRYDGLPDPYSVKAALRLIRSWDLKKGTRVNIGFPWIGYDITLTI